MVWKTEGKKKKKFFNMTNHAYESTRQYQRLMIPVVLVDRNEEPIACAVRGQGR
jgi:hypothetical protein